MAGGGGLCNKEEMLDCLSVWHTSERNTMILTPRTVPLTNSHQVARSRIKSSASSWHMVYQHHPDPTGGQDMFRGHVRSSKHTTSFATAGCANCSHKRFEYQCRGPRSGRQRILGGKAVLPPSLQLLKWVSAPSTRTPVQKSATGNLVFFRAVFWPREMRERMPRMCQTVTLQERKMENIKYLLCQPGPNTKSLYIFKDVIKRQLWEFHITRQGLEVFQHDSPRVLGTQEITDNLGGRGGIHLQYFPGREH